MLFIIHKLELFMLLDSSCPSQVSLILADLLDFRNAMLYSDLLAKTLQAFSQTQTD